jgi:hypothetical protein
MAQNISQIYIANPASSMASLDLIYLGRSPYGIADDFAIEFGDFQDSISSIGAALDVTVGNNLLVSDTNGILDESSNAQLLFSTTASAVNYLNLSNAATGNGPSLVVAGTDTDIDLNINAKGTGDVLFNGSDVICGDPGTEASGININGVTYDSALKVSDIAGANIAQFILHRHSTTLQSLIVGARSNSDTSAHGVVTNGQSLLTTYGVGWTASHYDIFGCIDIGVDSAGTVSATSSPGRLLFQVTADASNTPTTALTIGNDKAATFAGALSAASLQVDNVNIDGNTVSSTSGTLVLETPASGNIDLVIPTAGRAVKIINTDAAGRTGFNIYRNTNSQMFTLASGLTSAGGAGGDHTFLSNVIAGGNIYLATTAGNALATSGVDVVVGGALTSTLDATINGVTAGKGNGSNATNTLFGAESSLNNSSLGGNCVFGGAIMTVATSAGDNTAMGRGSLNALSTGDDNVSIGRGAATTFVGGVALTTGSSNTFLGHSTNSNSAASIGTIAIGRGAITTIATGATSGDDGPGIAIGSAGYPVGFRGDGTIFPSAGTSAGYMQITINGTQYKLLLMANA